MSGCDPLIDDLHKRLNELSYQERLLLAKLIIRNLSNILVGRNYHPLWGLVKNSLDISLGLITKIQESEEFMWDSEASYQSAQAKIRNYDEMRTKYEEYRSIIGKVKGALNDERQ